ncbi:ATP-dependent RNA helicase dbp-4 [Coprinopsis sp. MPI-PUGE-AT-0042]|nr:ATP-dependent RNA helicase dbp-4 [Coprinopsis sp. MPI-PUGE-AT-0042]
MTEGSRVAGPSSRKNGKGKKKTKMPLNSVKMRRATERQAIDALEKAVLAFEPPKSLSAFADLPISEPTKRGLKKASFVKMTDIQAKSIPVSLKGKDVLGAARTGSGKTLAFLIPVLEVLYRQKWGPMDGLGALIISPTRELAVQIFEVLRAIGPYHQFSAGLVIGGKDLKVESERLSRMNILVATPGRLLQHMDQTVGFETDNLQMLVLDEADRILDMGFKKTLAALLSHLPKSRQTLLFSATQTDSVSDLARLSLKDPEHIGVIAKDAAGTTTAGGSYIPDTLEQHYILTDLDKKLDILWSFIKTHLQSKILVFLSSCKQVRFVFETFCKMHPGVPLLHLHGKQKQTARLSMYTKFTSHSHAVMFATDIAARGLDFPSVDWVVQVDAPEDVETYIHRVGRTARYESKGKGLLFLLPSEEEGMTAALTKKGLNVQKIKIRQSKTQGIQMTLQKLCFEDPEIKYLGQRTFVSYLRSIYLQKNKAIFKLDALPVDRYAESLGLPGTPKIKFLNREIAKLKKNASRDAQVVDGEDSSEGEGENREASEGEASESEGEEEAPGASAELPNTAHRNAGVRTKYDKMFQRKNQNVLSSHYNKLIESDGFGNNPDEGGGSDDEFITLKRADHELPQSLLDMDPTEDLSRRKQKLSKAKKALATGGNNSKLVFDDEGKPHELYELADGEDWMKEQGGLEGAMQEGKRFAMEEREKIKVADVVDKAEAREKKKERKRKRKEMEKMAQGDGAGGPVAYLDAPSDEDDGYVSPEFDLPPGSDEDDDRERPRSFSPPPAKRFKKAVQDDEDVNLDDDEQLALRLLRRR